MPRLIVLNGPPGIGKSTLARRFAEDHPLSLMLEQDIVRGLVGGWRSREVESGAAARNLCLAMAGTHLRGGLDVIVPQFVTLPSYLDRLREVARESDAQYLEFLLHDDPASAERRFHERIHDPLWAEHQRVAEIFIAQAGGFRDQYERLLVGIQGRNARVIASVYGDAEATYAALLAAMT